MAVFMRILPLLFLFGLTSCAYVLDNEATQEINVVFASPQETKARCYFKTESFKQNVIVPGVVRMQKSHEPIDIYCVTANGPVYISSVEPELSPSTYWNIANGVIPGGTFDYLSKTAYVYPSEIVVDYSPVTSRILKQEPLKTYHDISSAVPLDTPVNDSFIESAPLEMLNPSGEYISRDNSR